MKLCVWLKRADQALATHFEILLARQYALERWKPHSRLEKCKSLGLHNSHLRLIADAVGLSAAPKEGLNGPAQAGTA